MCRAGRLTDAKELFSRLFEKGLQPDVYTYSIIIKGLCNEGLLDEAYKVFRGMEECGCLPNGCCYNVIIQGFLRHKDIPEATLLIDEMVDKGFSADATTFELVKEFPILFCGLLALVQDLAVLLQGLWEARQPGIALEVFKNMCSHGQQPNKVTFSIILDGLCKQGYLDEALALFKAMEKSRLKLDCVSFTILIDGLCKEGLLDEAYKVFRGMEKSGCVPNGCCYNVIIQGFLWHKDVAKATQLIDEMVDKGFSADATTFELPLASCILSFYFREKVGNIKALYCCYAHGEKTQLYCGLIALPLLVQDLALVLQVQVLVLPYKNKELPLILHMMVVQIGNSVSL
ncbi:hypothetical protein GH714_023304 [Hevea brasiliensis]|uniref:Pentacotripeptide-repeat region of PRORP domain-containing protein n=1 Tax=Hevea brasiliensis TaxID=3981 RepID=A0A6A6LCS6_HEVBR|nr:hypothetical protein GH714_023304 [Hevea brasiliensis]